MVELADAVLSLCKLLRNVQWKDQGDAYELGCIAERVERMITDQLEGEYERDVEG